MDTEGAKEETMFLEHHDPKQSLAAFIVLVACILGLLLIPRLLGLGRDIETTSPEGGATEVTNPSV